MQDLRGNVPVRWALEGAKFRTWLLSDQGGNYAILQDQGDKKAQMFYSVKSPKFNKRLKTNVIGVIYKIEILDNETKNGKK